MNVVNANKHLKCSLSATIHLKMVKVVNFMSYILYYSKKRGARKGLKW